jgi:Na+/glutamate symporter
MTFSFIGVAIMMISIFGSMFLAGRNASDKQRQTKILLFLLYFWLFAFVQLLIAAVVYSLMAG